MAATNQYLSLARTVVVGVVSAFSVIIFALSADMISVTNSFGYFDNFAALSLATAILSLLSLPAMLFISMNRKGAFTSYIAVELAWFWLLWIMWVASAGSTAALTSITFCTGALDIVCSGGQAIEAFAFLNWILIMAYTTTLLVFSITSHLRGNATVWTSAVREFDFAAPRAQNTSQLEGKGYQYPVTPQVVYPPQHVAGNPQSQYPPHNGFSGTPAVPSSTAALYPQVQV